VEAERGWAHLQRAGFEHLKTQFGVNWALDAWPRPAGLACAWHSGALALCRIA
jgi:hypothetical protein